MMISCNSRDRINKEIKNFYHSQIELPLDSMMNLSSKTHTLNYDRTKYIYVMYVDSTSCSDCAISHLSDWSQLYLIDNYKDSVLNHLFIIAPKREQYIHVSKLVAKDTVFNKFVFIDTTGVFERSNPNLPTNKLLHTFLINRQRKVELIGNPLDNTQIKKMLAKLLEQNK